MTISKRALLSTAATAAIGAVIAPPAWARRIRVLDAPPEAALPAAAGPSPDLERAIRALRVGAATRHGALTVLWLTGRAVAPPLSIATLDEARAAGALAITERDQATVPELVVENRGKTHVLLLAGEILVGGKQNRVLREDILLPPWSGPRSIAVYCVEQGRWNEGRRDFESKASFAQPGLRREVFDKADQTRVWSEVARSTRAAAAPSASYQQVYEQPAMRDQLAAAEQAFDGKAGAHALGACAFVGPTLSGLDVFRDPGLFAREWPKLLRAHAAEAYSRPPGGAVTEARLRAESETIVKRLATVQGSTRGNAGVGQVFEWTLERQRGVALTAEGGLVHAALL